MRRYPASAERIARRYIKARINGQFHVRFLSSTDMPYRGVAILHINCYSMKEYRKIESLRLGLADRIRKFEVAANLPKWDREIMVEVTYRDHYGDTLNRA